MFFMSMPLTFKVGDTAPVRVNKQPATLLWRDANTLVLNGTDARRILHSHVSGNLRNFTCTDEDGWPNAIDVVDNDDEGGIMVVAKQPRRNE